MIFFNESFLDLKRWESMVCLVHSVCFIDGQTEAQSRRVTCPRSQCMRDRLRLGFWAAIFFFHKQILGEEASFELSWGWAVVNSGPWDLCHSP